ncbi:MAG TPA: fused MFS/spermidine synthase [Opitutaceae bacterium]|nr:fused MFS/spermidine synthase [Opitutaceae bacterium]
MKFVFKLAGFLLPLALFGAESGDYVESFDTTYNSLTVEKRGSIVELRARSRRGEALESAVDLSDPLTLVVPYTRSLYAGLFFQPQPQRVLMIGLGGAGFHRLFAAAYPDALLQTVELDPKVLELCEQRLAFKPTARTPVAVMDGRMFVKRDKQTWDWIVLDAFRGGFVPPHLKTEEFYRECAARLSEHGVFISNLHATSELYHADIKTILAVFPQVVLFGTAGRGNVIACAVKYRTPDITDPAKWPAAAQLAPPAFAGRLDLEQIRAERIDVPLVALKNVRVLTDDFAPVEFLDAVKSNNTTER